VVGGIGQRALAGEAVVLLDIIPGVARATAEAIVAEIGVDMSRFESADHLASWAGVAPGNNESGGNAVRRERARGINLWERP
jgi:transposase